MFETTGERKTDTCLTTWLSQQQKSKTILNFNEDDKVAVASAEPYANHLHLAPDR